MALPNSGTLTLNDIQNEFGGTNPIGLGEYYRGGTYVPNSPFTSNIPTSGNISVSNFYGTAKRTEVQTTIFGPTTNYDVYANRSPFYIAGITDLTVTVNSGVSVGSTSTGGYALLVPSEFSPTDTVTIYNNGTIQGAGGTGGTGQSIDGFPNFSVGGGSNGAGGGGAVYVNRPTTIYNNNVIAGGGGGGAGGRAGGPASFTPTPSRFGGGGGGGGAGFSVAGSGGAGGPASGLIWSNRPGYPGQPGTASAGGTGGAGSPAGPGGPGGGLGSAGTSNPALSGGAAGNYIVGNGFVNWAATGTRYGGVA